MSKFMRKAFTLVELLVVVAILAILASVAIIGYSSFTKKAQQSVDEQAVTQMNTLLTGLDTLDMPENINEFYKEMHTAGLSAKDYKPLYNDRYFFWDKNLNQVLYTDKNYNVLYPEKYVGDSSVSNELHQWYSLNGKIETSTATVVVPQAAPVGSTATELTANSAADFVKISEYVQSKTNDNVNEAVNLKVNLPQEIDLMGADTSFLEAQKPNAKVELSGESEANKSVIKGLYISDNHATTGRSSTGEVKEYGAAMFNVIKDLRVENVIIDGATIGSSDNPQAQTAIFAAQATGEVYFKNVTIRNCKLYGGNKSGLLVGYVSNHTSPLSSRIHYENVRIENCEVIAYNGEVGLITGCYIDQTCTGTEVRLENNDVTIVNSIVRVGEGVETYTVGDKNYVYDSADQKWRIGINELGFIYTSHSPAAGLASKVATKADVDKIMWKFVTALTK